MYSIYKIKNKINSKLYIGYSKRPAARWYDHKKHAIKNKKGVIYDAMRKHGVDNFEFEIIYQSWDEGYTKNVMEDFFIKEYGCRAPVGYNNAPGGQGGAIRTGYKHSETSKIKISLSRRNKKHSDEVKEKISLKLSGASNPMYGKHHTQKTKNILSEKAKNRKYNPGCRKYLTGPNNPTAKTYIIETPESITIKVTNLKHFCLQNNLHQGEMRGTLKGRTKQHKGYRVVSVV
jgi:group I intron endonuclease